jgi:hypothetical protein
VGCDVSVDSETLLMTNFINLKIKPTQSFESAHSDRLYMRVFIGINIHMYISIFIYTVFLKNIHMLRLAKARKEERCQIILGQEREKWDGLLMAQRNWHTCMNRHMASNYLALLGVLQSVGHLPPTCRQLLCPSSRGRAGWTMAVL